MLVGVGDNPYQQSLKIPHQLGEHGCVERVSIISNDPLNGVRQNLGVKQRQPAKSASWLALSSLSISVITRRVSVMGKATSYGFFNRTSATFEERR
jgi:hypothetical protein